MRCTYCYYNRHGHELYPVEIRDPKTSLHNIGILLDYLIQNDTVPGKIEIFSGEPFATEFGFQVFTLILDKFKDNSRKPANIIAPTNGTFLLTDKKTARVESLLESFKAAGIPVFLSLSVDGKYEETNRPMAAANDGRNDDYYERVFTFAKKHGLGFHPMVYSDGIDRWQENFLWFQAGFARHGIDWTNLYLLEVRNPEWSPVQCDRLAGFMRFLVKWSWDRCGRDPSTFREFLFKGHGFNILSAPFSTVGRGIGCSVQSTLYVRVGDLAIVPCHRTMYPDYEYGRFTVEDGKITGITSKNVEMALGVIAAAGKNMPYCQACTIKSLCSLGCLGAQYESTGDFFTPIPTVCQMEHAKVLGILLALRDIGMLNDVLSVTNADKRMACTHLLKQGGFIS